MLLSIASVSKYFQPSQDASLLPNEDPTRVVVGTENKICQNVHSAFWWWRPLNQKVDARTSTWTLPGVCFDRLYLREEPLARGASTLKHSTDKMLFGGC